MSKISIVDPHFHWWDLENNYYPWLQDQQPNDGGKSMYDSLSHTYLYNNYLDDSKKYNFLGGVHIQADWNPDDPLGESVWLQNLIDSQETNSIPQAFMGFTDLSSEKAEYFLERQSSFKNCVGIRHMLNFLSNNPNLCWASEDFTKNERWVKNFSLLKKYNLDFDLMCFSNHMEFMAHMANKHSDTKIHLEHTGMPHDFTKEGTELWRNGMKKLAQCPNVDVKISGLGNTIPHWNEDLIRPWVLETIDIFGIDRVMFASNFPTDSQFSTYDDVYDSFLSIVKNFTPSEQAKMFSGNAIKQYNLNIQ